MCDFIVNVKYFISSQKNKNYNADIRFKISFKYPSKQLKFNVDHICDNSKINNV